MFQEFLESSRDKQTNDERFLQTQLISRLAFVSSQIKDLDFTTHRQIIERGLAIGNTSAECIVEAETTLQELAEDIGSELMEIANIARMDFMRIPNVFVHPFINGNERLSQGILSEVMTKLSDINAVTNVQEIIGELNAQQEILRSRIETIHDEIEGEIYYMTRQMNYLKAEVFPILEYSLQYYNERTEEILALLSQCN